MNKHLILLIPLLIIIGYFSYSTLVVNTGEQLQLQIVQPIDPVDKFRGNYVDMRYDASQIAIDLFSYEPNPGETVYLTFHDTVLDKVKTVSRTKPESKLCMRGEIRWVSDETVFVRYNIDSYFVEEESALFIEKSMGTSNLTMAVRVDTFCNPTIEHLYINGSIFQG
ncbi:MAG: putative membrane-anchored protein [Candidatus Woesearchaeota archaeon]|jgi:uncharacterized membrane-anchored protein